MTEEGTIIEEDRVGGRRGQRLPASCPSLSSLILYVLTSSMYIAGSLAREISMHTYIHAHVHSYIYRSLFIIILYLAGRPGPKYTNVIIIYIYTRLAGRLDSLRLGRGRGQWRRRDRRAGAAARRPAAWVQGQEEARAAGAEDRPRHGCPGPGRAGPLGRCIEQDSPAAPAWQFRPLAWVASVSVQ